MSTMLLSCVTTEGGLFAPEILQRILAQDRALPGMAQSDYHLDIRLGEASSRAWTALQASWRAFRTQLEKLPSDDAASTVTRDKWLLPLFRELGYGWLARQVGGLVVDDEQYPFSHVYGHVPLHFLGARVSLDKKDKQVAGAARMSPHGLLQQFLNRSDNHLWGMVSNGLTLRLLRDHYSLSTAAYVEFDLERMFDGGLYSEFLLLFLMCHQSRVEAPKPEETWLERWFRTGQDEGVRSLDRLRAGVEDALVQLGTGFIKHPENSALRDALRQGRLQRDVYFRELLRLLYRVLFIFVAEDRDALVLPTAPPDAKERFSRYYSSRRLRELALSARGSAHSDLWEQLRMVLDSLWEGEPALALPALGSGLFDPEELPDLVNLRIDNIHLLAAVRALAEVTEGGRRIRVSYRNLGAQELGSVYESLLELHPTLNLDAGTFELSTAAGHERKTTGSYYTPASLVECLLDSALDPVVDDAVKGKSSSEAEAALLDLKVCDPACGSGHFLVAAARRIADRLARVRTPDEEPSPAQRQHAMRDVVGRCLFGVDINPMAVELCKVSLWMEALEPGRPLSFLDAHIQCGNALLGATPALLARGIPDEAWEPLEGDDKKVASALKKQSKKERTELTLDFGAPPASTFLRLSAGAQQVDSQPDDDIRAVRLKEGDWGKLVASTAFENARFLGDLWCAAFLWHKQPGAMRDLAPTEAEYRRLSQNPDRASGELRREVLSLREQHQLFHWHLAFPQVLRASSGRLHDDDECGWEGGFDVVLGNPPWERVKLQEQEFFASRSEEIVNAANAATRKKMIAQLRSTAPSIWKQWCAATRKAEGESHIIRQSGRYPLCGRGDVNTYAVFAEHNRAVVGRRGRAGFIVPSGIATDETTKDYFGTLISSGRLASLYDYRNHDGFFYDIGHRRFKFCLITVTGRDVTSERATFVFFAESAEHVHDPARRFTLTAADIALLNPNTGTGPTFRSRKDADINLGMYRRSGVLWHEGDTERGNSWNLGFMRMFDMTNDAILFRTAAALESTNAQLEGNVFGADDAHLPLLEAKMFHHFDHRFGDYRDHPDGSENTSLPDVPLGRLANPQYAPMPRYWVPTSEVQSRLRGKWSRNWLLGFRDICRSFDERTVIASLLPRAGVGNTSPLMLPGVEPALVVCLYGSLCSFVLDYAARQKVGGTHLNYLQLKQLPVLPPATYLADAPWHRGYPLQRWLGMRVLELTFTSWVLEPFAHDVGYYGPPFRWDIQRRFLLRCELDAAFFHLYGLSREDANHVMDTFPIVRKNDEKIHGEYRTKRVILEIYDDMAEAARLGKPYQPRLDPPPADPRIAHADTRTP
ncbi:MAG: N-6 DNA methylase [Deltaproteobacteria bacterium]|nr:N-6 DNA methylase [Deltaproteobacteria bacterium]